MPLSLYPIILPTSLCTLPCLKCDLFLLFTFFHNYHGKGGHGKGGHGKGDHVKGGHGKGGHGKGGHGKGGHVRTAEE